MTPITFTKLAVPLEHTSFWMKPETIMFIRSARIKTGISQATILELIVDYYRISRRLEIKGELSEEDIARLKEIRYFFRILPY